MQVEKVISHIVAWLKEYAETSKMKGFVLGISGGIDSAVVSTLCARTGLKTLCVTMPIHQAEGEADRATEQLSFLKKNYPNVRTEEVDLTPVFDAFTTQIPKGKDAAAVNFSLANVRSRLRMTCLYYFAGLDSLLVAGTGNKIEDFGVGFFTKYGDGGVDLSPIAELMKSEVYKLGEALGVPESIQQAVPTDGLFADSRTDEEQIGASYPELEWAMKQWEKGFSAADFSGREKEVFTIFINRNKANQHKINPVPVCKIPENLL